MKLQNRKRRTARTVLTSLLLAVSMLGVVQLTPAQAEETTRASAQTTLEELELIDAAGEENTADDLPDKNTEAQPYLASNGSFVIAIDAGHGGTDGGATYDGMMEKELNLKIAQYIESYFADYEGVEIYMTRTDDTYLSLSERVANAAAAGADVFISIHNNSSSNLNTSGSMVFYPNSSYRPDLSTEGAGLSQSILDKLTALGLPDLGIRIRDSETGSKYADGSISDYYGIIRNAKLQGMTGIIVEHAFVSCEADRKNYLGTDAQLQKLAIADAEGIAAYYGLTPNTLVKPSVTLTADNQKKLQVSWNMQETAKGYLVYRAEQADGKYTRLAKVTGAKTTSYADTTVMEGKTYYYKVRAYGKSNGSAYYSDYSSAVEGYTIGGTELTQVKQAASGYFKLSWTPYTESDGYALYRSTAGGAYERIATITDAAQETYKDKTVTAGVSYEYKIRTLHTLYGNEGFGKCSAVVSAVLLKKPEMKRLDIRDDGHIKVVWTKASGASKYVVQRSTSADGTYQTIATITNAATNYYLDKSAERGMTYYYKVNAYNQSGIIRGSTGYVTPMGAKNFQTPQFTEVSLAQGNAGISLQWSAAAGANGYRIYRSTKAAGGFKKIKTIKGGDKRSYVDTSAANAGTTYYYKVKAYVYNSAGTAWSDASDVSDSAAGYLIMGASSTMPEQMAAWYTARGGVYPSAVYADYGAPTLADFCQIVFDEAEAEGVKAEVVFGQVCKETGFLRFGGDVAPEQCNFAGIGATGGVAGLSFADVRTGIRAQVQHLKAYASTESLNQTCVDPRFSYVKRGSAIYVEWLGINENPVGVGWATGKNYGYSLRDDYISSLLSYSM